MATQDFHLFYWPTSSASQKALMAVEEKQLSYKRTVINIAEGEQNQPWYLTINPAGLVPVLKVGDRYIADSEKIFDVVDSLSNRGSRVVPHPETEEGQLVQAWREKFSRINVFRITYGTIVNPSLREGELQLPPAYMFTKDGLKKKSADTVSYLEGLKSKHPALVDALDRKIKHSQMIGDPNELTEEKVEEVKRELDVLFDEVEAQLRKSRTENIIEHWLCGPSFTAADINLIMLLGRVKMLTYFSRYANPETRPAVVEYWNQACRRPCVQKVVLGAKAEMMKYYAGRTIKTITIGAATAIGALVLGLFVARK